MYTYTHVTLSTRPPDKYVHSSQQPYIMKSKAARTNLHIDLDAILVEIGETGRYQIALYATLCVLVMFTSNSYLSYIFTAGQLDYR